MTVLPKPHSLDYGTTLMLSKYPPPFHFRDGKDVSWYTYRTQHEAQRASLIAENIAVQRGGANNSWMYQLPGQIVVNADGTFTVTVV